jgi:hypothetical protein
MTSQTTSSTSSATYTKLRDGSWGLRVTGTTTPKANEKVVVAKRDGTSKVEHVAAILWSGDGVHLCSISQCFSQRPLSPQRGGSGRGVRGTWTGCSCGSVEEYERRSDCSSCRHDRY